MANTPEWRIFFRHVANINWRIFFCHTDQSIWRTTFSYPHVDKSNMADCSLPSNIVPPSVRIEGCTPPSENNSLGKVEWIPGKR
jgi:hypothetical protein